MRKIPWVTLTLLIFSLAAQAWETLGQAWQLDCRVWLSLAEAADAAGSGEAATAPLATLQPWQLWSAHFSHWTWEHWLWDGLIFALLGTALELGNRRTYLMLLGLAPPLISLGLLLSHPDLDAYRGLSALDSTLWVAWCLQMLNRTRGSRRQWLWGAALLAFGAKVTWETLLDSPLFVDPEGVFVVLPAAHLLGGLCGFLPRLSRELRRSRRSNQHYLRCPPRPVSDHR